MTNEDEPFFIEEVHATTMLPEEEQKDLENNCNELVLLRDNL